MSSLGKRIEERRILKNLKKKELAKLINVHDTLIGKYERDEVDLGISKIKELAQALNTTPAYLMGWTEETELKPNSNNSIEEKIITNVNKLNETNKINTYKYTSKLLSEQNMVKVKIVERKLTKVLVTEKVAAGNGYSYGNNEVTPYYTDRTDLSFYDMATMVSGDSMYPTLNDGDVILLQQGYDNVNGDIYVIDYDGHSYVKKLYNDGTRFVLKSINEKYDDIIIYISDIQNTYFNIVGKVIDSFTPVKE